jgi:hypothetical protein
MGVSSEERCADAMKRGDAERFKYNFHGYKADLYRGKCSGAMVDPIFSYMLLLLLAGGETSQFLLLRADAEKFLSGEERSLESVDGLWTAYSVGDIPMARNISSLFPREHRSVSEQFASSLTEREQGDVRTPHGEDAGSIERITKISSEFFRI